MAAVLDVAPDIAALATAITERLQIEPSEANWSAVIEVVAILVMQDSRNISRLKKGHSVPQVQRSTMASMVAACNPGVDPDHFVEQVLHDVGAALAAER